MLDTIRSHVRSLARTVSGRLRPNRSLVVALLLVFLVGVGAASVTIHTLGLNPITGASNAAGDPIIVESQSLSITNGNADSTTLVLRHPSEHRVACTINGTLRDQQGGIVDQTATESLYLPAGATVSTTLDFPSNPATSEYLIFETATTGCEMLGWPMFGFNPTRMGTSTRLISAIAGPQTLDEHWGFQSPNAAPMVASPALANGTVYVGSVDDSLYALNATNGSKHWSYPTGGDVNSTATVAGGTVYVGSNNGTVAALDAADGTQQWANNSFGPVASSPAVVDGTVYVGSDDGSVYALDASDGSGVWSYATAGPVRSSPAVVNGTVYVGSDDGTLSALDAADGSVVWADSSVGAVGSSPAVVNGTVYVGSDDGAVYAFDASDGSELWNYSTAGNVSSSPAVVNGTVYVGSDDGTLYALGSRSGTVEWSYDTGSQVRSSPAVVNETVYVGSDDGTVYAMNATTGVSLNSFNAGDSIRSGPVVSNNTVYVSSTDGYTYALEAASGGDKVWLMFGYDGSNSRSWNGEAPTGAVSEFWNVSTGGAVTAAPVVANKTVYVGSRDGTFYALSESGGTTKWTNNIGKVRSAAAVAGSRVIAGSDDGSVYALDSADGSAAWTFGTGGPVRSPITVGRETAYFGSDDDSLYALDTADGSKRWSYRTGGDVRSAPAVVDGSVYAGSADGKLYALDAATGQRQWIHRSATGISGAPTVVNGTAFLGSTQTQMPLVKVTSMTTTKQWRKGEFNGTSGQGPNGTRSDELWMGYDNGTSSDSLVGYYRMDGSAGTATDYSGNSNDGTTYGAITSGTTGTFGTDAYDFDGNDDLVNLSQPADLDITGDMTVVAWVNADNLTTNNDRIVAKDPSQYVLRANTDTNPKWEFAAGGVTATAPTAATTGNWTMVAGRYDDSTGNVELWIDGKNVSMGSGASISSSGSDAYIGYFPKSGGGLTETFFDGSIDEVQIYDRKLSKTEMRALYRYGGDGTYTGNYSRPVTNSQEQVWKTATVNVSTLPATDVTLDAEFVAKNTSGTIIDRQSLSLSEGTNQVDLSVANSENAELRINGTTTNVTRSWWVRNASFTSEAKDSSGGFAVDELTDWNLGSYDATSADGNATRSGQLSMGYMNGSATDDLHGYWRFDGAPSGSGGTFTDYSSFDNTGTTTNNVDTDRAGVFSTSGVNVSRANKSYVDMGNSDSVDLTGNYMTVSAWIKFGPQRSNRDPIISKGVSQWEIDTNSNKFIRFYGEGGGIQATSGIVPNQSKWYHVVARYDGSRGQEAQLWVNGTKVAEDGASGITSSGENLTIGREPGTTRYGSATVDEVRIYDTALSNASIGRLYRNGRDGTFSGNYSTSIESKNEQEWRTFRANVTGLPPATSVDATIEARNSSGVVDSQTVTLTGGSNAKSLSLAPTKNLGVSVNGSTTNVGQSWRIDNFSVDRGGTLPPQTTALDYNNEWARGNFDGTTSDAATFATAGTLSMRYGNGTAGDSLQSFYRFDGDAAADSTSINDTISTTSGWDAGAYNGTTADAGTAGDSGDLAMRYANGTTGDNLRGFYRFDRDAGGGSDGGSGGTNLTIATAADWNNGTYDKSTADAYTSADAGALTMRYPNGTTGDNLQGYWRLDSNPSGSGGTYEDYSGNGNTGTTTNNVGTGRGGVFNSSGANVDNADNSYVNYGNPSAVDVTGGYMTVSFWTKLGSQRFESDPIVSKGTGQYHFSTNSNKYLNFIAEGYGVDISTGTVADENKWYHVVGRIDYDRANEGSLWINGTKIGAQSTTNLTSSGANMTIGYDEPNNKYGNATVDELRVYDRALSDQEIKDLYRTGTDGTYESNYTRTYAGENPGQWDTLEVDVGALPPATSADVTVEAIDSSGTVVDSSTHALSGSGVQSFSLALSDATDTRVVVNGTSTDPRQTFAIDRLSLTSSSNTGTALDYSGNGYNGTTRNGVTTNATGVFGTYAYNFSGVNDTVDLGEPSELDTTGNISISTWVNVDAVKATHQPIVTKGNTAYLLKLNEDDRWEFSVYNGTGWRILSSDATATADSWVHLAGEYDAATGQIELWVNGTSQGTKSATLAMNDRDVAIGNNTEKPGREFNGTIDEVRIYNRTFSNGEVRELYRWGGDGTHTGNYTQTFADRNPSNLDTLEVEVDDLPSATSADVTVQAIDSTGSIVDSSTHSLTGTGTQTFSLSLANATDTRVDVNGTTTNESQTFDVGRVTLTGSTSSSGMTRDYSGNGIDASTSGGISTGVTGTFNSTAFDFDGTDDHVAVGQPAPLNLTSDMTITGWVNIESGTLDLLSSKNRTVIGKGTTQYELQLDKDDMWRFKLYDGTSHSNAVASTATTAGTWVHLAARHDDASNSMSLWINGTKVDSASISSVNANGDPVWIGNNSAATSRNFNGRIDELRVYNESLSSQEISTLYRTGGDGTHEGNYTHTVDTERVHSWTQLTANVTGLPPAATVDATVEARRDDGTVVASQTVSLAAGETSHSLSLNDTTDARILVNGTTTSVTETWAIENLTLERDASPSLPGSSDIGSGPSTVLDTQSEWDGGTYDRTSSHGATASDAGNLSMRYLNGTGSDDLHGYYRLDRNVAGGKTLSISSAADWNQGAFNGTTSDGADGTVNDRLTLTYANGTTGDTLHGYWRMDRSVSGSGGTVLDYSGGGSDGATYNSVTTGDAGILGTDGIGVSNTDAYAEVNDSANLSVSGDFALSVWIKTTTFGTSEHSKNQTAIVTKGNYNNKNGYALIDDGDYSSGVVWRVMGGSKSYDIRVAESEVNDGNWHQLVGVYDSGTTRLYLNGTQVSSTSNVSFDTSTVDMGIGADRGGGRSMGSGNLDEVQLYNRSLTDSEVRELYRWGGDATFQGNYSRTYAGENPGQWSSLEVEVGALPTATSADVTVEAIDSTGTVVDSSTHSLTGTGTQSFSLALADATDTRIEINGTTTNVTKSFAIERISLSSGTGSSQTAVDYSGDGNDATMRDGATTNATGVFGSRAYEFNGTAGYVDLDQPSTLNFTNAATISAWVHLNRTDAANGTVVAKGESQYRLLKNDADEWVFATDDGTRHAVATTSGATPGAWVHLVGRVDPSASNPVSLWVNGSQIGATSGGMTANTHDVTIGRENETGGDYFDGSIDEVRLYDRALSDAEIRDLYRRGGDGTYDGNYSKVVETSTDQEWERLVTNVTGLPSSTAVEATVEARQTDGTVLDSQTITLSAGQTSHNLSLPDSSEARITVNGTTTAPTETWAIENVTLVNTSTSSETGPLPSAAEIAAVNASTGVIDWGLDLETGVTTSPAVAGDTVYVGLYNGSLMAFDASTGDRRWRYHADGAPIHSSPAVVNNTVYFGGNSSVIYAVNATDGTQRWTLPTNGPVRSAPAPVNGTVYVGADDTGVRAAR